jgi:hypothetical protein
MPTITPQSCHAHLQGYTNPARPPAGGASVCASQI